MSAGSISSEVHKKPIKKYIGPGFAPEVKAKFKMCGYLLKEKSSDVATLIGPVNKRYFTFDGKVLNYYQDEDTAFLGPSGSIPMREIKFVKLTPELPGYAFSVFTSRRTYRLQAYNDAQRAKWIVALQNIISAREKKANDEQNDDLKLARDEFSRWKWNEETMEMEEVKKEADEIEVSEEDDDDVEEDMTPKEKDARGKSLNQIQKQTEAITSASESAKSSKKQAPKTKGGLADSDLDYIKTLRESLM